MRTDTTEIPAVSEAASLDTLNDQLEGKSADSILRWVRQTFGEEIVATSSFQTQSLPLLHLISQTLPDTPIIFLDTGFHFPETLQFRDRVAEHLDLNVRSVTNELGHDEFRRKHGALYRRDPDMCCYLNKVEPLERALEPATAWIAGIRREQTEHRRDAPTVDHVDKGGGTYKICPLLDWSSEDVASYREEHELPEHPLTSKGYPSIGCAPCTECPSDDADDERAGRWSNSDKTECGIHLEDDESVDASPPDHVDLDD